MQIYDSIANMEGVWLQAKNNFADGATKQDMEMVSGVDQTGKEGETLNEEHDFYALCKKFPKVSFVVVDEIGELQWEYSGICNTSTFGNFGQISIEIDKKVIENLDSDWDNIVAMIQWMSDHYDEIVGHAKATSSFEYTMVNIHYAPAGNYFGVGGLSYTQTICSGPPLYLRTFGEGVEPEESLDIDEEYLRSFLMKVQNDSIDTLFEIGEDKQEHKTKTASKAVEEYQEHFVYSSQYEAVNTSAVEKAEEMPEDINAKRKELARLSDVSLHMTLMNEDERRLMMKGFFRGQRSAEQLKDCIMQTIRDAYNYGMKEGAQERMNGFLDALHVSMKNSAVWLARSENILEGREVRKNYGITNDKYVYYNSDYYYACEEACELIASCFKEFAEEEGLQDYKWSEGFGSGVNPKFSYNSIWEVEHKSHIRMINTKEAPPRNFTFFFGLKSEESEVFLVNGISVGSTEKSEPYEKQRGIGRYPTRYDHINDLLSRRRGKYQTMYDHIDDLLSGGISEKEESWDQLRYLKNFRIISLEYMWYSYQSWRIFDY